MSTISRPAEIGLGDFLVPPNEFSIPLLQVAWAMAAAGGKGQISVRGSSTTLPHAVAAADGMSGRGMSRATFLLLGRRPRARVV